jgi:hypothetical protein
VVLPVLCACLSAEEAELPSRPSLLDLTVTTRVRQALAKDSVLGSLNLFVKVHEGVATLSGPIPDAEVGQRAVKIVREVKGVYEVRNQFYLAPSKPAPLILIPLTADPPMQIESASPKAEVPIPSTGKEPPTPSDNGVTLGAPIPLTAEGPTRPVRQPATTVAGPMRPQAAPAPEPLTDAIKRIRGTDERFRLILIEVRSDGAIWVFDDSRHGEAVTALAQALGRLPGVQNVVIKYPR